MDLCVNMPKKLKCPHVSIVLYFEKHCFDDAQIQMVNHLFRIYSLFPFSPVRSIFKSTFFCSRVVSYEKYSHFLVVSELYFLSLKKKYEKSLDATKIAALQRSL